MEDKKTLKLIDNNGKEVEYEILLAFYYGKTNKNYIVYTDNSINEDGSLNTYALIYYPEDDKKFETIETTEEWDIIEERLSSLK